MDQSFFQYSEGDGEGAICLAWTQNEICSNTKSISISELLLCTPNQIQRVGNVLSRSKGQCSRSFKSNSVRPFLGIEPPLFALPLLRAPNRNHRVGAAASDSTHTESVAPTADTESPPLDQVLQVEATAIVTVPMRWMMEEREAAELEIKTSSSGRRHCIYGNAIPNSQAEVEREREREVGSGSAGVAGVVGLLKSKQVRRDFGLFVGCGV